MAKSLRLGMPLLAAGQAQKEITHNEALLLLDAVVHGCCSGAPSNTPPHDPEPGLSYICGPVPTAAWTSHPSALACWTNAGWRFVAPFDGLEVVDREGGRNWRYMSGQWSSGVIHAAEVRINGVKVIGSQQGAIAAASGGGVVDVEARNVLAAVLQALRAHGLVAPNG